MRALLAARHTGVGRPAGLTVSAQRRSSANSPPATPSRDPRGPQPRGATVPQSRRSRS